MARFEVKFLRLNADVYRQGQLLKRLRQLGARLRCSGMSELYEHFEFETRPTVCRSRRSRCPCDQCRPKKKAKAIGLVVHTQLQRRDNVTALPAPERLALPAPEKKEVA